MKMNRQFALVALVVLASAAAQAQFFRTVSMAPVRGAKKVVTGPKDPARKQIETLEEQWRVAQLNADTNALKEMMSDEFIGISSNGMVQTREQWLERTTNRKINVTKMDVEDQKIKIINGTTAIVTTRVMADGEMDGRSMRGRYLYTRVYAKQPGMGGWKVMNFEATRIQRPNNMQRGLDSIEQQ